MRDLSTALLIHTLRATLECVDEALALDAGDPAKLEFKRVIEDKLVMLRESIDRNAAPQRPDK